MEIILGEEWYARVLWQERAFKEIIGVVGGQLCKMKLTFKQSSIDVWSYRPIVEFRF